MDTDYAFSNAALGVFNSYTESNSRYDANERQSILEWFVPDTWKITRRLTLHSGIRFSWSNEMYPNDPGQQSVFARTLCQASRAPPLFVPVMANGVQQAQNPVTGALLPAAYVGLFVPGVGSGSGRGAIRRQNYPRGFVNQQPVLYGPRLGFAFGMFLAMERLRCAPARRFSTTCA